jgi:hypothetical protein
VRRNLHDFGGEGEEGDDDEDGGIRLGQGGKRVQILGSPTQCTESEEKRLGEVAQAQRAERNRHFYIPDTAGQEGLSAMSSTPLQPARRPDISLHQAIIRGKGGMGATGPPRTAPGGRKAPVGKKGAAAAAHAGPSRMFGAAAAQQQRRPNINPKAALALGIKIAQPAAYGGAPKTGTRGRMFLDDVPSGAGSMKLRPSQAAAGAPRPRPTPTPTPQEGGAGSQRASGRVGLMDLVEDY